MAPPHASPPECRLADINARSRALFWTAHYRLADTPADTIQWWHDSTACVSRMGGCASTNQRGCRGTELDLVIDDEGDDLTEHERQALHETLSKSWSSAEAGKLRPAAAIISELRRKG